MGGIRLDPKRGVNPALTVCPRCGGETNELVLAGLKGKYKCEKCGQRMVGRFETCPRCGAGREHFKLLGEFDGSREKVLASEPCDKCKKMIEEHAQIVREGGIYWKCKDCESEGVIKPSPFATMIREKANIQPPDPVGFEFDKTMCPVCGPDKVV